MNFVEQLDQMASEVGLSSVELLKEAELSPASYYGWKNGTYKPTPETVGKVLRKYDTLRDKAPAKLSPEKKTAEVFSIIYGSPLRREEKQTIVDFILALL